jgi:hypothetical protein
MRPAIWRANPVARRMNPMPRIFDSLFVDATFEVHFDAHV